ncbi:hypothetical protein REPUB_Repub03eG0275200 [Reevesia pubescens]
MSNGNILKIGEEHVTESAKESLKEDDLKSINSSNNDLKKLLSCAGEVDVETLHRLERSVVGTVKDYCEAITILENFKIDGVFDISVKKKSGRQFLIKFEDEEGSNVHNDQSTKKIDEVIILKCGGEKYPVRVTEVEDDVISLFHCCHDSYKSKLKLRKYHSTCIGDLESHRSEEELTPYWKKNRALIEADNNSNIEYGACTQSESTGKIPLADKGESTASSAEMVLKTENLCTEDNSATKRGLDVYTLATDRPIVAGVGKKDDSDNIENSTKDRAFSSEFPTTFKPDSTKYQDPKSDDGA